MGKGSDFSKTKAKARTRAERLGPRRLDTGSEDLPLRSLGEPGPV